MEHLSDDDFKELLALTSRKPMQHLACNVIDWYNTPEDDWITVLEALPVGEYIEELPYLVHKSTITYRLPIPTITDVLSISSGWAYLEFTKVRIGNRYIWRRTA